VDVGASASDRGRPGASWRGGLSNGRSICCLWT